MNEKYVYFSAHTTCGFNLFIYSFSFLNFFTYAFNTSLLDISYVLGTLVGTRDIISRKPENYFHKHNDRLGNSLYFCGYILRDYYKNNNPTNTDNFCGYESTYQNIRHYY